MMCWFFFSVDSDTLTTHMTMWVHIYLYNNSCLDLCQHVTNSSGTCWQPTVIMNMYLYLIWRRELVHVHQKPWYWASFSLIILAPHRKGYKDNTNTYHVCKESKSLEMSGMLEITLRHGTINLLLSILRNPDLKVIKIRVARIRVRKQGHHYLQ